MLQKPLKREDVQNSHNNIPPQLQFGKRGLINEGNTCYANSLLQVLQHLAEFKRIIYKINCDNENQFPAPLQELFYELGLNKSASARITSLIRSLNWSDYEASIQHDVTEFFMMLIEVLENKLQEGQKQAIANLFKGVIKREIRCINVDETSKCDDEIFLGLPLQVKDHRDVVKSLERYYEKEMLKNENQFRSDKYGQQDAERSSYIEKVPPVMVFYLMRFLNEGGHMKKILDRYEFYEELNQFPEKYHLYAVLVHVGKHLNGGHYYTYIRDFNENQWYKFNDMEVKKVTSEEAIIQNYGVPKVGTYFEHFSKNQIDHCAYMLVYVSETYRQNENLTDHSEIPQWLQDKINLQIAKQKEDQLLQQNLVIHQIQYENIKPGLKGILFQKNSLNFQLDQQRIKQQFSETKAEKIYYEKNKKFSYYLNSRDSYQIFMYKATKNVNQVLTSESITPIQKYLDLQTNLAKQILEQDLALMALIRIDIEEPKQGQILCLIKFNSNDEVKHLKPIWVPLEDAFKEMIDLIQVIYEIKCTQAFIMLQFTYQELSLVDMKTLRQLKNEFNLQDVFTLILSQNKIEISQPTEVEINVHTDIQNFVVNVDPNLSYDQIAQLIAQLINCPPENILIKYCNRMEFTAIDCETLQEVMNQNQSFVNFMIKDKNQIQASKHPVTFYQRSQVQIMNIELLIFQDSQHSLQLQYRQNDQFSAIEGQIYNQISSILSPYSVELQDTQLFVMLYDKEYNYLSQVLEFGKYSIRYIEKELEKHQIKLNIRSKSEKKEHKIFCNFRIGIQRYDKSLEPVWFQTDRQIRLKQLLQLVRESKKLDQRTMNRLKVFVNGEPSIHYRNNLKQIGDPENVIFDNLDPTILQNHIYVDIDLQQNDLKLNV